MMTYRKIFASGNIFLLLMIFFSLNSILHFGPAEAMTTILSPVSYTTTHGSDGKQPVDNLHLKDQLGTQNNWNKYIEFIPRQNKPYQGYRTYILPDTIDRASITALQVEANFLGAAKSEQTWTWRIYDWTTQTWMILGDNADAPDWTWYLLTFQANGTLANYVDSNTGEIRIKFDSNNAVDNSDLDYEVVLVRIGAPLPTPTPTNTPPLLVGADYYVAPHGNDNNSGHLAAPWRTIQQAANRVGPGSTVYVRGGVYNEKVTINVSGSETEGHITFRNYPGETPILDGTGLTVPLTDNGMILIIDKSYIVIKNFEIRNYKTSVRNRTPVGIHVRGAAHHLEIRNNRIHDIETNAMNNADAHGLAVYGTKAPHSLNNIIISGNELYNLKLGSSEALVLNGNVENFKVNYNSIHDSNNIGIDLIGFEETAPDPFYDQARYGVVQGNTVYNIDTLGNPAYASHNGIGGYDRSAGGIYVDGGKVITIKQNVVHAANIGIEIAGEHQGRATSNILVQNNVLYNNSIAGLALGGYDTQRGSTENCTLVNNTLYNNDLLHDGGGELLIQYDTRNNIIKNNILYAGRQGLLIGNDFTKNSGNIVDYNLYFVSSSATITEWQWQKRYYASFAAYRAATGNDAHSMFIDPQFTATSAAFDFHLLPASPAINAGQNLDQAGAFDIDNEVRIQGGIIDLGADERGF